MTFQDFNVHAFHSILNYAECTGQNVVQKPEFFEVLGFDGTLYLTGQFYYMEHLIYLLSNLPRQVTNEHMNQCYLFYLQGSSVAFGQQSINTLCTYLNSIQSNQILFYLRNYSCRRSTLRFNNRYLTQPDQFNRIRIDLMTNAFPQRVFLQVFTISICLILS